MVTDAEYQAWLQDPNAARVVLLEAEYLDGGVQKTFYAANAPYVSEPSPAIPAAGPYNTPYDDVLASDIAFSRRLSGALTGRSSVSRGDLTLYNDGSLDAWLGFWFDGQPARLYLGSPVWSRDEFRLIFKGASSGVRTARNSMVLGLRDGSIALDREFDRSVIGSGPNAQTRSPLSFGRIFNASPVLVDTANHIYQVHDGALTDVLEVRDRGVVVPVDKDLPNGRFSLQAAPAGEITCDIVAAGSLTAVGVAEDILTRAGVFDRAGLTELEVAAPFEVGLYVDKDLKFLVAMDQVLGAVGAYWFFDRFGVFTVGRMAEPVGLPDLHLVDDDIDLRGLSVKREFKPLSSVVLGYRKNHKVQTSLAGSLTESDIDLYARAHTVAESESASVGVQYPGADSGAELVTLLANESDCSAEAGRRLGFVSVPRRVFEIKARAAAFASELGDLGLVEYPGFGFESGGLARVVGITDYPAKGRCILEVWH